MTTPRILLVEDDALIALDMQDILEAEGFAVVGPANTFEKALALATSERINAATLDVDLGGKKVWRVAQALRDRAIPFVFLTGITEALEPNPDFADVQRITKPVNIAALRTTLAQLLR